MDTNTIYTILNEARRTVLNQKDGLYNVILTISGGALILSITFLERFGINPKHLWVLKDSWIFLVVGIISNILMRYLFNEASIVDLNKQHFKLENPNQPIDEFFKKFKPEQKFIIPALFLFWVFWLSFIGGIILLLIFSFINT